MKRHLFPLVLLLGCAPLGGAPVERSALASDPVAAFAADEAPKLSLWGQREEAEGWSAAVRDALDGHGAPLLDVVPADIEAFCPGYAGSDPEARKGFWVAFLSALARWESTWRPEAEGGRGRWIGLLQISPRTAQAYGCAATDTAALKRGAANLACGIRIMARTVPRDGVIAEGRGGVAADWAPLADARLAARIRESTSRAPVCRG